MPQNQPQIHNFGCRLNIYEGELMRENLKNNNAEDVIVVNSCAVTNEAERQSRQAVRKLHKQYPDKKIIFTGCAAQINPEKYADMPEISQVIGNQEKANIAKFISDDEPLVVNDIMAAKEGASHLLDDNIVTNFEHNTRAFLQIQNGCNHRCTFCIIPFGRGNNRSVPFGAIASQASKLVDQGYNEIIFTGVDITDYGKDLPGQPTLGQICRRLLKNLPNLKRLRLSSIDVAEFDEDLYDLLANEPRLMPHLHISLQAGDDMVLKRMKRRHTRDDLYKFAERARALRPDVVFGADIIAGFPTETDEMFNNTAQIVQDLNLIHLHVFPYSARQGTPAAKMPQVPMATRKGRAKILRDLGEANLVKHLQTQIDLPQQVLVESGSKGKTEQYLEVDLSTVKDIADKKGQVINVTPTGVSELSLTTK